MLWFLLGLCLGWGVAEYTRPHRALIRSAWYLVRLRVAAEQE